MNVRKAIEGLPSDRWGTYAVFGLTIRSAIPLTELLQIPDVAEVDIVISLADLPTIEGEVKGNFAATSAGAVLNVPEAGRYLIRDGREILVHPDPKGSERHLRLYLLGSAIGALLHQRQLLPLHSNAIELDGRAVAFLGASGAGKSTMAAWFHDRGYNVLADDVCVVTFASAGQPLAHPGIPRLRLWRDALETSGRDPAEHEHAFDDADKYNVRTRDTEHTRPLPLSAIYLLDAPNSGGETTEITRLNGVEAMEALVANTYRGVYISILRGTQQHIAQCLKLARHVPIFKLSRTWGFQAFDEQVRQLERHANGIGR